MTALVAAEGSASHPLLRRLAERSVGLRDLADAVHAFCGLHGRMPGVIEHAAARAVLPSATDWLRDAERGIAGERAYLAQLTSVVGPLPSTPGQAETEAAIAGQRHALDMLAQSDRAGCALGTAAALALDWEALRQVFDAAAVRFAMPPADTLLPKADVTGAMLNNVAVTPGIERAVAFGAQQVLAQHRGLWDLLEARASARNAV